VFRTGVRWCCVAAALGLGFAGEPARADIDWSDSGTLVIDVLPNGHGPSWSEGWDFELDATLVARGWGDSNEFGVSAPGGPPRERSVRFTDGIPIGHARVWAYYLVGDPPQVEIIDPGLPELTDSAGRFSRPRAFSDPAWAGVPLGLLAQVIYIEPGTDDWAVVVNYAGWDPYRPLTAGSSGDETIEFPQPVVLQGGLGGGTSSWFDENGLYFGEYLLMDPAEWPKNGQVDGQGRRVPGFLVFVMPNMLEQPWWGYDNFLPMFGIEHDLNARDLNNYLIEGRLPGALRDAGLVEDQFLRNVLQLNLCGYSMGGPITRAWMTNYGNGGRGIQRYVSFDGVHCGTTFYGAGDYCLGFAESFMNGVGLEEDGGPVIIGWNHWHTLSAKQRYLFISSDCVWDPLCWVVSPNASAVGVGRTMMFEGGTFSPTGHQSRFTGGWEWHTAFNHDQANKDPIAMEGAARFLAYGLPPGDACYSPADAEPCGRGGDHGLRVGAPHGACKFALAAPAGSVAPAVVNVDTNMQVAFEIVAEGAGAVIDVLGPGGTSVVPPDAVVVDLGVVYRLSFALTAPATGEYTVQLHSADEPARAFGSVQFDNGRALALQVPSDVLTPGVPAIITAYFSDDLGGILVGTNGEIVATVTRPDGGEQVLPLFDDGAHYDELAGDGIYGDALSQTAQGGRYTVRAVGIVDFDNDVVHRTATSLFMVTSTAGTLVEVADERIVAGGSGLAERLELDVIAGVEEPGEYLVRGTLVDAADQVIASATVLLSIDSVPATEMATLRFLAADLVAHGVDGPWTLTAIELVDSRQLMVVATLSDYQTVAYDLDTFAAPAAPTVASLVPNQGSRAGGQEVILLGTAFDYVGECEWAGSPIAFEVVSDSAIRVVVPAALHECEAAANVRLITPWHDVLVPAAFVYLPALLAWDLNCDGVVDSGDLDTFCDCMAGPETARPPGCDPVVFDRADQDGDLDVDLADFAAFQVLFGN
jgi:hypothetical protein